MSDPLIGFDDYLDDYGRCGAADTRADAAAERDALLDFHHDELTVADVVAVRGLPWLLHLAARMSECASIESYVRFLEAEIARGARGSGS